MEKNEAFKMAKESYEYALEEQKRISREVVKKRKELEEVCPHEEVVELEKDPFLMEYGMEDEGVKVKCLVCSTIFYR